jgi:hypothetical protein
MLSSCLSTISTGAWDVGRSEAVLVQLDRGFELFLKAAILHKGGKIRERRARQTIGFALSFIGASATRQ